MKKYFVFFIMIWKWFISLFTKKVEEKIVEKETLTDKLEKREQKSFRRREGDHPPHNNRSSKRNKRGVRSRFTQYRPQDAVHGGKPIYHTVLKSPSI